MTQEGVSGYDQYIGSQGDFALAGYQPAFQFDDRALQVKPVASDRGVYPTGYPQARRIPTGAPAG